MEQALKQAPEGSGAVTIPGGVQKPCRYGTSGHGLAGVVLLGWQLDVMILAILSNLKDWFYDSFHVAFLPLIFLLHLLLNQFY